jgi:hypothetical protein
MASIEKLSNFFMASNMTSLYYFNLGFLEANFFLTCETIKLDSPLTCRVLMFISMARLMPRIRALYSAMLFV